jgi:asparagine synthase (glutamine-hydrolysing)
LRYLTAAPFERLARPKYASLLEHGGTYSGAYLLARSLFLPWELNKVLDPDFARQGLSLLQTLEQLDETTRRLTKPRSKVTALQMKWYMRNQLLRDSDWAGMAHSVEIRIPLVDIRLLDQLRDAITSSHPPGKDLLARTPRHPLPEAVICRPKTGFGIPVQKWLASLRPNGYEDAGLRGWARFVYESQVNGAAA